MANIMWIIILTIYLFASDGAESEETLSFCNRQQIKLSCLKKYTYQQQSYDRTRASVIIIKTIENVHFASALFHQIFERCNDHYECDAENTHDSEQCVKVTYLCSPEMPTLLAERSGSFYIATNQTTIWLKSENYPSTNHAQNLYCELTLYNGPQHQSKAISFAMYDMFISNGEFCLDVKESFKSPYCAKEWRLFDQYEVSYTRNNEEPRWKFNFTLKYGDRKSMIRFWIALSITVLEPAPRIYDLTCHRGPDLLTSQNSNNQTTNTNASHPANIYLPVSIVLGLLAVLFAALLIWVLLKRQRQPVQQNPVDANPTYRSSDYHIYNEIKEEYSTGLPHPHRAHPLTHRPPEPLPLLHRPPHPLFSSPGPYDYAEPLGQLPQHPSHKPPQPLPLSPSPSDYLEPLGQRREYLPVLPPQSENEEGYLAMGSPTY